MPQWKRCTLTAATWNTCGYPDGRFYTLPEKDILFLQEGGDHHKPLEGYRQLGEGSTESQGANKVTPRLFVRENPGKILDLNPKDRKNIVFLEHYKKHFGLHPKPLAGGVGFRWPAVSFIRLPADAPLWQIFALVSWHSTAAADSSGVANRALFDWLMALLRDDTMRVAGIIIGGDFNNNLGLNRFPRQLQIGEDRMDVDEDPMDVDELERDLDANKPESVDNSVVWQLQSILKREGNDKKFSFHLLHSDRITQSARKTKAQEGLPDERPGGRPVKRPGTIHEEVLEGRNLDYFVVMLNKNHARVVEGSAERIDPSKGSDHWGVALELKLEVVSEPGT